MSLPELLGCLIGVVMFAILLHVPHKSIPVAALIGTLGYVIYKAILLSTGSETAGYFIATCALTLSCEASARYLKIPSTVFLTIAIIPLVPGVGVYETMLCILEGNYSGFVETGAYTILIICTMAAAIALCSQIFRLAVKHKSHPKSE